jgi:hypothetical protein
VLGYSDILDNTDMRIENPFGSDFDDEEELIASGAYKRPYGGSNRGVGSVHNS